MRTTPREGSKPGQMVPTADRLLAVVAEEVAKHGAWILTLEHIAALARVCRSSVKNALREAHNLTVYCCPFSGQVISWCGL